MDPTQNPQPQQPYQPEPQPLPQPPQPSVQQPFGQPVSPQQPQQPAFASQPQYAAPQENPGQLLGIISIIMIFVFPVAGIVLGALSRSKSKKAGMPSGLGTAGLVINIVVTVLSILALVLFISLAVIGANASKSSTSSSDSDYSSGSSFDSPSSSDPLVKLANDAKTVQSKGEAYYAIEKDYPKTDSDFGKHSESTLPNDIQIYSSLLLTNSSLTYIYCGAGSAQIVYLGTTKDDKRITPLGSASSTEVCTKSY